MTAYRLAVGYFRTKLDAETWAKSNFRPKNIKYVVYPVQGVYSLQVGIFTRQENVEPAIRELYNKYRNGTLPVRTETVMLDKPAYHLSISRITESLARKVQNELFRLDVRTELSGS